jgi:hypothetical protein
MATNLTLHLDDEPGELARLGQALGAAGVNIEGFCSVASGGGRSEIHLLVEDATDAFAALQAAGFSIVSEQEVAVIDVEDRPGMLGEVGRRLGDAKVNITLAYLATGNRLVFGADNLAAARAALE